MEKYINEKVIVRADRAGIFYGTLIEKDSYGRAAIRQLREMYES